MSLLLTVLLTNVANVNYPIEQNSVCHPNQFRNKSHFKAFYFFIYLKLFSWNFILFFGDNLNGILISCSKYKKCPTYPKKIIVGQAKWEFYA